MKNTFRRRLHMIILAVVLAAVLPFGGIITAMAAHKLSNSGEVDGIDADPEVGRHNSYAWCAELFEQTDGDYLWVGTNRDAGGTIIYTALAKADQAVRQAIYDATDIPAPVTDNMGKIYRCKIGAFEPEWELMYEDAAINGYRKMLVFKGDLYVFAGLTNRRTYSYSAVYRFKPGFKQGDKPEVVLWHSLAGTVMLEYFRAACVYDGILYVGTFDSKIYCTDGAGLASLTPNNAGTGEKSTGWTLAMDLKQSPVFDDLQGENSYIWDIIGFNGSLYAFVTGNGFRVYKLTMEGGSYTAAQIVGEHESSRYYAGLGIQKHVAASPFISTAFGGEYVYVTTFANGPIFLTTIAKGDIAGAFEEIYCPATVYRFDKDDNWEVVVGDTAGENTAVSKNDAPIPKVGNMRAGFFPGADRFENPSANQYVWWMAEYEGKLYASTWDMGVFRDELPLMIAALFIMGADAEDIAAVRSRIEDLIASAEALYRGIAQEVSAGADGVTEEITAALQEFADGARGIDTTQDVRLQLQALLQQLTQDVRDALASVSAQIDLDFINGLIDELQNSAKALLEIVVNTSPETQEAFSNAVASAMASGLFLADNSDPAGFDLFVSGDGASFEPYTVTGFGDPFNYGGRVILPTEHGLFLMTANPFYGCQVWQLDDVEPAILADLPEKAEININGKAKFYVKSTGADPSAITVTVGESQYLSASVSLVRELEPVREYVPNAARVFDPLTYGLWKYEETTMFSIIEVYLYEVTLTGLKTYEGTTGITVSIGDLSFSGVLNFKVTSIVDRVDPINPGDPTDPAGPSDPGDTGKKGCNSNKAGIVLGFFLTGLAALLFTVRKKPF